MTSISVKFRPCAGKDGVPHQGLRGHGQESDGSVFYQIIHRRQTRQVASGYELTGDEWRLVMSGEEGGRRISSVREGIGLDLDRLRRIVAWFQRKPEGFSADDVAAEFRRLDTDLRLDRFIDNAISDLLRSGKPRTAETYRAAAASFARFRSAVGAEHCLRLDHMTVDIIDSYNRWLRDCGAVRNTVSFYNRLLRAIYNRALDAEEVMDDRRPFRRAYTGIDRTVKRALPLETISRIASMDLSDSPALDFGRDMFILSFCLRGMSFVDMAFLRKTDLRDGRLSYRRRKTGQMLEIEWTPAMRRILDKHPANETGYLLPVICRKGCDERRAYRNCAYKVNRSLKVIGRMFGVGIPLTLYVARHSWASAALEQGVPVSVISKGMGHDSEKTTRIYLAEFDNSAVDDANARIIDALGFGSMSISQ